ncbi:MAG: hypothetical protein IJ268_03285 [Proteobacteria bacterium]|nr:hypothetical protein [Pseudomonadota bacterium]
MSPFNIYRKTMIFSWMKLGLGLLTFVACLAIGFVAYLTITNMAFELMTSIAIGCSAFLIAVAVYFLIMAKLGYSIEMGHLAIIERADRGEDVPSNPVEFSKTVVAERFGNSRKFYKQSRDVQLAYRQMARVLGRGFSLDKDTPELGMGRWLKMMLSHSALSCVNECCLAYALRRSDYEVNAACVDALTRLVQDWRSFNGKALSISLVHVLVCLLTFALFFVPGFLVFKDMGLNMVPWLGVAFFLTLTVKVAFYDSFVLSRTVCAFLEMAGASKIEARNYAKLDKWSKEYAKLRSSAEKAAEKAEDEADRAERAARKSASKTAKSEAENAEAVVADAEAAERSDSSPAEADDGKAAAKASEAPSEASEASTEVSEGNAQGGDDADASSEQA